MVYLAFAMICESVANPSAGFLLNSHTDRDLGFVDPKQWWFIGLFLDLAEGLFKLHKKPLNKTRNFVNFMLFGGRTFPDLDPPFHPLYTDIYSWPFLQCRVAWAGPQCTHITGAFSAHQLALLMPSPEIEFLDISLTKGSSLLLHAIHSTFYLWILKILYSTLVLKIHTINSAKQENSSLFMNSML